MDWKELPSCLKSSQPLVFSTYDAEFQGQRLTRRIHWNSRPKQPQQCTVKSGSWLLCLKSGLSVESWSCPPAWIKGTLSSTSSKSLSLRSNTFFLCLTAWPPVAAAGVLATVGASEWCGTALSIECAHKPFLLLSTISLDIRVTTGIWLN